MSCLELVKLAKRRLYPSPAVVAEAEAEASSGGDRAQWRAEALAVHRNAFLNLAVPLFAFSDPVQAERYPWGDQDDQRGDEDEEGDGGGESGDDDVDDGEDEKGKVLAESRGRRSSFTIWDTLDVWPESKQHLTLGELIDRIQVPPLTLTTSIFAPPSSSSSSSMF